LKFRENQHRVSNTGILHILLGGLHDVSGILGRALRYNVNYCRDKRYCSLYSLITTGNLYGADFCYRELPQTLDIFDEKTFFENPTEFYAVCTDVETGEPLYHKFDKKEDGYFEWFRASASLPLVSKIVEIGGKKLLDGGISDSIPIKFFEEQGYDKKLVILTQPKDYVKGKNKLMPVMKLIFSKYPKLLERIKNRHNDYNQTTLYVNEKEKAGEIFVIRPDTKLPINRTEKDPEILKQVYNIGRQTAEKQLDKLKEYLN
ncbi:MAG: patatin family protein, partial [Clostridia bacterium]|nr:patatin family protein [Clostridia bacterium]